MRWPFDCLCCCLYFLGWIMLVVHKWKAVPSSSSRTQDWPTNFPHPKSVVEAVHRNVEEVPTRGKRAAIRGWKLHEEDPTPIRNWSRLSYLHLLWGLGLYKIGSPQGEQWELVTYSPNGSSRKHIKAHNKLWLRKLHSIKNWHSE